MKVYYYLFVLSFSLIAMDPIKRIKTIKELVLAINEITMGTVPAYFLTRTTEVTKISSSLEKHNYNIDISYNLHRLIIRKLFIIEEYTPINFFKSLNEALEEEAERSRLEDEPYSFIKFVFPFG